MIDRYRRLVEASRSRSLAALYKVFDNGADSQTGKDAQKIWLKEWRRESRLNRLAQKGSR